MRERWARTLALLTGVVVVGLSAWFGWLQNPTLPDALAPVNSVAPAAPESAPHIVDPIRLARGRAVFDEQSCASCHSIAGVGSPRNPLDGVGTRRSNQQLRDWIVAADPVAGQLTQRIVRTKRDYAQLPADEMSALVDFLRSLDQGTPP